MYSNPLREVSRNAMIDFKATDDIEKAYFKKVFEITDNFLNSDNWHDNINLPDTLVITIASSFITTIKQEFKEIIIKQYSEAEEAVEKELLKEKIQNRKCKNNNRY